MINPFNSPKLCLYGTHGINGTIGTIRTIERVSISPNNTNSTKNINNPVRGVRGTIGLNSEDRRRPLACRMLRVCGQGAPIEADVGDIKIIIRNALYIVENKGFIDVNKTGWRSRARKCPFLCFSSQNGMKNRPFRLFDGKNVAKTASGVPSFLGLLEAI